MRKIFTIATALALSVVGLGACSSGDSASQRATRKSADAAAINDLEVVFHRAMSTKDIDSMMSLYSNDAVFTVGGQSYAGKEQIRKFISTQAAPFKPENHWVSETPAYKIRLTSNGDRGTLYFECHYVDVDSKVVKSSVSADVKVSRVNGRWMFTNVTAAPAVLS
jgi:uncharacterized protein (TIGR02246 family)